MKLSRQVFPAFIFFAVIFTQSYSQAVLGEHQSKIATVEKVKLAMKSQVSTQQAGYVVHELTLDGTVVKEYADPSGTVFAVSWKGLKQPDLSVVFGTYFAAFKAAREKYQPMKGVRMVSVKTSSLVVTQGGHMRNLHGFAYVPTLVPQGLDMGSMQ